MVISASSMILVACLTVLVALGLLERAANRRARAAVPIRIHVNGTRGKSTVTRLIAGALREAGIPTIAKVTGTAPRLIETDGSEHRIARYSPANIREQAWLLRRARRAGARALVVECMAIRPDLQRVSEREIVHATIGVITNARLDHTEVMGSTAEEVAESLASGIPRNAVLVTGDVRFADMFALRCAALETRFVLTRDPGGNDESPEARERSGALGPRERPSLAGCRGPRHSREAPASAGFQPAWLREDVAIALAATRELGVRDDVALKGMANAVPDPGAATNGVEKIAGHNVRWLDATAANDPESLDLLADERAGHLVVYNHRGDRPERLRVFAGHSATVRTAAAIFLTGDRPSATLLAAIRRLCPNAAPRFVPLRRLAAETASLVGRSTPPTDVIFCGNTRGWVRPFGRSSC